MIPNDLADAFRAHLKTKLEEIRHATELHGFQFLCIDSGTAPGHFRDDTHYPFRANAYFTRVAPLVEFPESILVIGPTGMKPKLLLQEPEDYWHANHTLSCAVIEEEFEVIRLATAQSIQKELPQTATAMISPRAELFSKYDVNPAGLIHALDFGCARKTAFEIACLRRANDHAVKAHSKVSQLFYTGSSEIEMHSAYLATLMATDQQLPYDNIIAKNQNAAVLHYTLRSAERTEDNSLLIDAGAKYLGYCSDITRTYSQGSDRFAELILAMDELQQKVVDKARAGVSYVEVHHHCCQLIGAILAEFKFINCSAEAALETGLVQVFFPHGTGHLLGAQVHDKGGQQSDAQGSQLPPPTAYPHLRMTRELEQDFVVTIEPGLYFIDLLLKQTHTNGLAKAINWNEVDSLKPWGGVRIEDNIVIQTGAPINLTREAFAAHSARH
jgi:Xaa-Pro dipeptidase